MLREIFKSIFTPNDASLTQTTTQLLLPTMYIIITVFTNAVVDIANLSQLGETILNIVLAIGIGYWSGREITYAALENIELKKTKEDTDNE